MSDNRIPITEELYLVDQAEYLHLKFLPNTVQHPSAEVSYAVYDKATGECKSENTIAIPFDYSLPETKVAARKTAIIAAGVKNKLLEPVDLSTLDRVHGAVRSYRKAHRNDLHRSIRFITPNFDEIFRIHDGGHIQITGPAECYSAKVNYIDDYHAYIGNKGYQIKEFAEKLQRNGQTCRPEPLSLEEREAWSFEHPKENKTYFLEVHETDEKGTFDFSVYQSDYTLMDGGIFEAPGMMIQEARDAILTDFLGSDRYSPNLTDVDCFQLEEWVERRSAAQIKDARPSILDRLAGREKHAASKHTAPQQPTHRQEQSL